MTIRLIAAPHTPMHSDGSLNLDVVGDQAQRLLDTDVTGAFIGGTTGECQSLTVEERIALADRWVTISQDCKLEVFVHVGHNSQSDAVTLAAHAAEIGADAIAAHAPCFFKPADVEDLIGYCAPIAAKAQDVPFYYYHIPSMTGVSLPTHTFLEQAKSRIPNLAGVKFTDVNLIDFQKCVRVSDGALDVFFGCDEELMAAYALGARGAVGSTYNFAAPLYHRLISDFESGRGDAAKAAQMKSVQMVEAMQRFGYAAACKAVMSFIGIDCGPVRSPLRNLTADQLRELQQQIEALDVLSLDSAEPTPTNEAGVRQRG